MKGMIRLFITGFVALGLCTTVVNAFDPAMDSTLNEQVTTMETNGIDASEIETFLQPYLSESPENRILVNLYFKYQLAKMRFDEVDQIKLLEALIENPNLSEWPFLERLVYLEYCIYADLMGDSQGLFDSGFMLLKLSEESQDLKMQMKANFFIGVAYYMEINDEKAKPYFNASLERAIEDQDYYYIAAYNYMMGSTLESYGEYDEAIFYYDEAKIQLSKDPRLYLRGKLALAWDMEYANVLYESGQSERGYALLQEIKVKISDSDLRSRMNYNWTFADLLFKDQAYEDSIVYAREGVQLSKALGDHNRINSSYNSVLGLLASALYRHGDYEESATLYDEIQNAMPIEAYVIEVNNTSTAIFEIEKSVYNEKMSLLNRYQAEQEALIQTQKNYLFALSICLILLVIIIVIAIVDRQFKTKIRDKLYKLSITDGLTQVSNRNHIIDIFESQMSQQIIVAMLDVDFFKSVNDTFGHVVGDHVLREIVQVIRGSIREQDHMGRIGGEEFLIVFDGVTFEAAQHILERVREKVEHYDWPYENLKTTVSLGLLSCYREQYSSDEILTQVDALLYEAKDAGRNRIVSAQWN